MLQIAAPKAAVGWAVKRNRKRFILRPCPGIQGRASGVGREAGYERGEQIRQSTGLDHRVVAPECGVNHQRADAGNAEDAFDHDRAAEQVADLQSDHRDVGNERIAKDVVPVSYTHLRAHETDSYL